MSDLANPCVQGLAEPAAAARFMHWRQRAVLNQKMIEEASRRIAEALVARAEPNH